ncbi:MAG: retroviral-like aspartic protease family protein [Thiotrichales bacterium]|nr:retroviral-like aspartic protease family protein [Thiotrichales bacterium]
MDKIKVEGLFKDKAIVTIDGKQRVLSKGKTSPEGVTLISANSREAIVELNGEQRTLMLGSHIGSTFKADTSKKSVTIAPTANGMYLVNGSINGYQVEFLVDTGATLIAMNKHNAKRIGLNYKIEAETGSTYTASGIDTVYLMTLDKVRVGDIELQDVEASVHDSDHPHVILLGNSFLGKLDLQREGKLMMLSK